MLQHVELSKTIFSNLLMKVLDNSYHCIMSTIEGIQGGKITQGNKAQLPECTHLFATNQRLF